jgi:CheY-like chemotaxis protein
MEYTNTVRLTESERREILARLDRESTPDVEQLRNATRWHFREACVHVVVEHPSGGFSRIEVLAKDLSETGMAVLHGGFLYPGSECQVVLRRHDGAEETLIAQVVRCRHITGRIHEVGLRFRTTVNPTAFVKLDSSDMALQAADVSPADLRGRVLYLDDSEVDQRLVAHHLAESAIRLTAVANCDAANAAMTAQVMDIVMCDVNLGGEDGVAAIRGMRQGGFAGPIVLVTAETGQAPISSALEAGATHQLAKPFTKEQLLDLMTSLHQEIGMILPEEATYSRLERDPGMLELIASFIEAAKKLARRLESAIAGRDFAAARDICLTLRGSAESYGFLHLSECAAKAVGELDAAGATDPAVAVLRKLVLFCDGLAVRTAGAA